MIVTCPIDKAHYQKHLLSTDFKWRANCRHSRPLAKPLRHFDASDPFHYVPGYEVAQDSDKIKNKKSPLKRGAFGNISQNASRCIYLLWMMLALADVFGATAWRHPATIATFGSSMRIWRLQAKGLAKTITDHDLLLPALPKRKLATSLWSLEIPHLEALVPDNSESISTYLGEPSGPAQMDSGRLRTRGNEVRKANANFPPVQPLTESLRLKLRTDSILLSSSLQCW